MMQGRSWFLAEMSVHLGDTTLHTLIKAEVGRRHASTSMPPALGSRSRMWLTAAVPCVPGCERGGAAGPQIRAGQDHECTEAPIEK